MRHLADISRWCDDVTDSMAAFVELGGALEVGCFNATMMIGG